MAKNYRATENSKEIKAKIEEAVNDVADSAIRALIETNIDGAINDDFEFTPSEESPEPVRNKNTNVYQKVLTLIPQFKSDIVLELKAQGDDLSWLRVKPNEAGDRWVVTINRDHPFMQSFTVADPDSLEPVLRIALAIAIAEIQGLSSGYESAGYMRLAINDLLRIYLSSRSDVELNVQEEI
jgi:hypothetical protein